MIGFDIRYAASAAAMALLGACTTAPSQTSPGAPVTVAPPAGSQGIAPADVHMEMFATGLATLQDAHQQMTRTTNGACSITVSTDRHVRTAGVGLGFWDAMERTKHALAKTPNDSRSTVEFANNTGTVRFLCDAKHPSQDGRMHFFCGDVATLER